MGEALKLRCRGLPEPFHFFKDLPTVRLSDGTKLPLDSGFSARLGALRPGGPISSRFLATNPSVLVVGENIFVHGGLHVDYHPNLEKINEDLRDWLLGKGVWKQPESLGPRKKLWKFGLLWSREYSQENVNFVDCDILERTLKTVPGAKRMIMGHTIQRSGINSACDGKSCRIDVGMSKLMGDRAIQVLEIRKGKLSVLTAAGSFPLQEKEHAGLPPPPKKILMSPKKIRPQKPPPPEESPLEEPPPPEKSSPKERQPQKSLKKKTPTRKDQKESGQEHGDGDGKVGIGANVRASSVPKFPLSRVKRAKEALEKGQDRLKKGLSPLKKIHGPLKKSWSPAEEDQGPPEEDQGS